MSDEVWYEIERKDHTGKYAKPGEKTVVSLRAWKPGDGLGCTHGTKQRREGCLPPVVLFKTATTKMLGGAYGTTVSPSVCETLRPMCAKHFIADYCNTPASAMRNAAEKRAQEKLLVKYWDEYQQEIQAAAKEVESEYLSAIPEAIRVLLPAPPEAFS